MAPDANKTPLKSVDLPSTFNRAGQLAGAAPTLLLEEADWGLKGRFEYNTDLFEAETIVRFLRHSEFLPANAGVAGRPGRFPRHKTPAIAPQN